MEIRTEIPGLYKDETTGAIINKNNDGLSQYKRRKLQDRKIIELEKRIETLEKIIFAKENN